MVAFSGIVSIGSEEATSNGVDELLEHNSPYSTELIVDSVTNPFQVNFAIFSFLKFCLNNLLSDG